MALKASIWRAFILTFTFCLAACGGGGGGGGSNSSAPLAISGTPVTSVNEDAHYEFKVNASGGSGAYTYSISNAPAWMTVSSSGLVSGTPLTDADAGVFQDIQVSVTDSKQGTAALPSFDLTVTAVNDAPEINVDTDTLKLDARQTFTVGYSVSDEEGDTYSVGIQGMSGSLQVELFENSIQGTVADLEAFTTGTLSLVAESADGTSTAEIDVTIYPLTDSGMGKTIFGSKSGAGVHLVILGDGYRSDEMELYAQDVEDFLGYLATDPGISSHLLAWNVHLVETPSSNSGSDDYYGTDIVDTYFDSGFHCENDIERLLCVDGNKVNSLLLEEYPYFNQALVVVNDARRGGSGGAVPVYSRNYPEIAVHEMGHSFADLGDEYVDESVADFYAGSYAEGRYANISTSVDPSSVPWAHWIDDKNNYPTMLNETGVGIFEGAYFHAAGYYRPLSDSRMRTSAEDFGAINSEQWIISAYDITGAVRNILPAESDVTTVQGTGVNFSVDLMLDQSLQSIEWYIDGVIQENLTNASQVTIDAPAGAHSISVTVSDISGAIRKSGTSAEFTNTWQLTVN